MFDFLKNLFNRDMEVVKYGSKTGKQKAYPAIDPQTGERILVIKDEKYPLRGFPRGHVLHGPLAPLKGYFKNLIIEQIVKCVPFKIPSEHLTLPVRELERVFNLMITAEDEPEMKKLIGQLRDGICMILEEDDAYRFRIQWFLEHLDIDKIKLSKSDKYYFRGKSFNQEMI